MTLRWRESARTEARAIFDYIPERNPAAAERLLAAIMACADALPQHPFLYRAGRLEGTREAVIHPNYIMVYRVTEDAVEIIALVHARRRYP